MITLTTNRGSDYLVVIVVPVDRFVEGRILNTIHHVTIIGVHRISSFPAVRCASTGRLFLSFGFPLLTVIVYHYKGIDASVNSD